MGSRGSPGRERAAELLRWIYFIQPEGPEGAGRAGRRVWKFVRPRRRRRGGRNGTGTRGRGGGRAKLARKLKLSLALAYGHQGGHRDVPSRPAARQRLFLLPEDGRSAGKRLPGSSRVSCGYHPVPDARPAPSLRSGHRGERKLEKKSLCPKILPLIQVVLCPRIPLASPLSPLSPLLAPWGLLPSPRGPGSCRLPLPGGAPGRCCRDCAGTHATHRAERFPRVPAVP